MYIYIYTCIIINYICIIINIIIIARSFPGDSDSEVLGLRTLPLQVELHFYRLIVNDNNNTYHTTTTNNNNHNHSNNHSNKYTI